MKALVSSVLLLLALSANAQTTNCAVIGNQIACNTFGQQHATVPVPAPGLYPQYQSPQQMQLQGAQAAQLQAQAELARQQTEALRQQMAEAARLQAEREQLAAEQAQLTRERTALQAQQTTERQKAADVAPPTAQEQERAKAVEDRLVKETTTK